MPRRRYSDRPLDPDEPLAHGGGSKRLAKVKAPGYSEDFALLMSSTRPKLNKNGALVVLGRGLSPRPNH